MKPKDKSIKLMILLTLLCATIILQGCNSAQSPKEDGPNEIESETDIAKFT